MGTASSRRDRDALRAQPGEHGQALDRRQFLRNSTAAGLAAMLPASVLTACGGGADSSSSGGGPTNVKATHGGGLGNLGIFIAKEKQLARPDVTIDFVVTPSNADQTTLFASGQVEVSSIPYSNFITAHQQGAPITIVAGAGVQGLYLVAAPEIKTAADLRGKTIGTFQADTLELLAYDYLKANDMSFKDVDVKYFQGNSDLLQAFVAGSVDAMSHGVVFALAGLQERKGSNVLTDGLDIYEPGYTNDILAVGDPFLKANPAAVKALIKGLMRAQREIETHRDASVRLTNAKYFKLPYKALFDGSIKQPFTIDQRGNADFILERANDLKALGYIKTLPDKSIFDFRLLEEVIKENEQLYGSLKSKVA